MPDSSSPIASLMKESPVCIRPYTINGPQTLSFEKCISIIQDTVDLIVINLITCDKRDRKRRVK